MDQVDYAAHLDPDGKYEKHKKYEEDIGQDEKMDGRDDGDDNQDPDGIEGQPRPLLDIQGRDDINL